MNDLQPGDEWDGWAWPAPADVLKWTLVGFAVGVEVLALIAMTLLVVRLF